MAAKYIIPSVAGSLTIAYVCDNLIAEQKIFGGTTPHTVSSKEWPVEIDKKCSRHGHALLDLPSGHEPHQPPKFYFQEQHRSVNKLN